MGTTIIVIDGFYNDPLDVRAHALRSPFDVRGNYPGKRTKPFLHDDIRNGIEAAVRRPISYWPEDEYNGAFQYTTGSDTTWVHADHTTNWSGVLFLTPDAPLESGTSLFRHRATGLYAYPADEERQSLCNADAADETKWEETDRVANVFNRLLLFDSFRFHAARGYFGSGLEDGRLFQTFFFITR